MPAETPIRVYIVDDHEVVRRGVASLLETDPELEVVGQSGSATVALQEILELRPDIAVLDANLADGTGVDICREMRSVDPNIKALILTSYDDPDAISAAILAGASGYVLKKIEGNSLLNGIKLVAGGHSLIDPAVANRVVEQMEMQRKSLDVICELTPQQRRIFFLIAEGMTNRQIAEKLYLAEKTVKNHVTGLLARLGLQHRTQAALLAVRLRGAESAAPAAPTAPAADRMDRMDRRVG
ncbi:response regulator [Nocardioides daeguensis]|uniref:Response regulator transcription factor n=1 Tax=Nocardioides daeguensis TaxID=908359 RepID=A0ABP6VCM2_9ACTN|nr:response regulator transcription factor [Nocardioides daeguensis]MBV6726096.1 response regulator transcription factor [Nocardioides daeguensis]MCR1771939.1 response regulator transcription factor [Nocardioides daeguensis]